MNVANEADDSGDVADGTLAVLNSSADEISQADYKVIAPEEDSSIECIVDVNATKEKVQDYVKNLVIRMLDNKLRHSNFFCFSCMDQESYSYSFFFNFCFLTPRLQ